MAHSALPITDLWTDTPPTTASKPILETSQEGPETTEKSTTLSQMPLFPAPSQEKLPEWEGHYHPFLTSPLWAMQRDYWQEKGPEAWQNGEVPHYITSNPTTALSVAGTLIAFLMDGLQNESIDDSHPIYILELGAGCGRFSYLLLKRLGELQNHYGLNALKLVLLISDVAEKNRQFLAEHPYLEPFLEKGMAQVIPFDMEHSTELRLADTPNPLSKTVNPLVVIANYVLDGLPQALFFNHYGNWYEAEVALLPKPKEESSKKTAKRKGRFAKIDLQFAWQLRTDGAACLESLQRAGFKVSQENLTALLDYYGHRQPCGPVLLPIAALGLLQRLKVLSGERLLVLGMDRGGFDQRWLQTLSIPRLAAHGSFSLPVNFHALQLYWELQNAEVVQHQHRSDNGLVFQMALLDREGRSFDGAIQSLQSIFAGYNPDDFFAIKRSLHDQLDHLTPEQMASYLRFSHFDYKLLKLFLPKLLEHGVPVDERLTWCQLLQHVWTTYFPIGDDDDFAFSLGLLAIDLSYWDLAQETMIVCLEWYGDSNSLWHNLGLTAYAIGQIQSALDCLQKAIALSPEDKGSRALYNEVLAWQNHCLEQAWYTPMSTYEKDLLLTPLGQHHAGEFLLQFRDPQIAALSRLPQLPSSEAVCAFIEGQQQAPQRATFAVVHQTWGLVGVVSFQWHEDSGYFYFWIGVDYQNQGLGQQAAKLACDQARAFGLKQLYTSSWSHNRASVVVLEKVGFEALNCFAKSQGYQEVFFRFHLALHPPRVDDPATLQTLLNAIEADTEVLPLEQESL